MLRYPYQNFQERGRYVSCFCKCCYTHTILEPNHAKLSFKTLSWFALDRPQCQIINGLIDFPCAPTLPRVSFYGTRSAGKPVFLIPKFRTSSYQVSFFPNALSFWNSLSRDIFDCHSFFSFKRSVFTTYNYLLLSVFICEGALCISF